MIRRANQLKNSYPTSTTTTTTTTMTSSSSFQVGKLKRSTIDRPPNALPTKKLRNVTKNEGDESFQDVLLESSAFDAACNAAGVPTPTRRLFGGVDEVSDEEDESGFFFWKYQEARLYFHAAGKEHRYWTSKIQEANVGDVVGVVQDAPYHIRNNKRFVMAAVQRDGGSLEYASPELRNDIEVVMATVQQNGMSVQFASPDLRNDKQVVMTAIAQWGDALRYASPSVRNDKEVMMVAVEKLRYGWALEFASPELQDDKQVVMAAMQNGGSPSNASPALQKDRDVIIAAFHSGSYKCHDLSPELRLDQIIAYIKKDPDDIRTLPEELKRDPVILTAAGMFDDGHDDAVARKEQRQATDNARRKIVFSTRYALIEFTYSQATRFTSLFKKSRYVVQGRFAVYSPNAFDKKTCDPQWTRFGWPCRGTVGTCRYENVLTKDGYPTDDCCWRYSFRSQLQEAKDTKGFMIQLVETDPSIANDLAKDATLGMGQQIELDMADTMGVKVFQVYCPVAYGYESYFKGEHIDTVTEEMSKWYKNQCQEMSVSVIQQQFDGDYDGNKNENGKSLYRMDR